MTSTKNQVLLLLNVELSQAEEEAIRYEEVVPPILEKDEKAIYIINRQVAYEKKSLLKRLVKNIENFIE